jgi:hypothetical protein
MRHREAALTDRLASVRLRLDKQAVPSPDMISLIIGKSINEPSRTLLPLRHQANPFEDR